MPWAKVDDQLHSHPKALAAGLEAMGLHLLAMSYVAAYKLEGRVPLEFVRRFDDEGGEAIADLLVGVGLWEKNGRGWVIHDWLKYNPSNAQAKRLAKERQASGKRGGEARANGMAG